MRILGYLALLLTVVLVTVPVGFRTWQSMDIGELAAFFSGQLKGVARSSDTYVAAHDGWLEFALSGRGRQVRVLSNASIPRVSVVQDDQVWHYAFEYQLLAAGGELVREGEYHHRTQVTRSHDPEQGRLVTRSFFIDPVMLPADARLMYAPIDPDKAPARIRLRMSEADPDVGQVTFRLYEREPVSLSKQSYRWQRLNETQRLQLVRGAIYKPDLLSELEKQNLLSRRWRPVGPSGIEDQHYTVRKIYQLDDTDMAVADVSTPPAGVYVDRHTNGVIPLPEGQWRVRLEWRLLEAGAAADSNDNIEVRWYGRLLGERSRYSSNGQSLEREFKGGLLEVTSEHPLVVRAYIVEQGADREITPDAVKLRAYRLDETAPLSYHIDHVGDQPTPLRIDVRALLTDEELEQQPVRYELLDRQGGVIDAGELQVEALPSRYDRLAQWQSAMYLSEPARHYFTLPPAVDSIRISAGSNLLLNAYSRAPDLVREVQVPENTYPTTKTFDQQPAWFVLRPLEKRQLARQMRIARLVVQRRPPNDDPRLLAGHYEWEDYLPDGQWRGRHLLIPRESGLPVRDQARAALYRELPANRETAAVLRDFIGHHDVRPNLIFQREETGPMAVTVLLDGSPVHETRVIGTRGELRLPVVAAGEHAIEIRSADATRWFMNYLDAGQPAYLRRLAMQIGADGLEFQYRKDTTDREVLTGQLYHADGERFRLHVQIEHRVHARLQPVSDWTFTDRIFDVRGASDTPVTVLNTSTATVIGGQRFFLPFGADLPPGTYRIRIRPVHPVEGYLTLYRLKPGQQLVRAFLRERSHVD